MIKRIHIENFKIFRAFSVDLNSDFNIVVGNNEAGKSTILEAIQIALTKRINGRAVEQDLSSFLFNKQCADEFVQAVRKGENPSLPKILIEVYLNENPDLESYRGTNNTARTDEIGLKIEIEFDEDYREEYGKFLEERNQIKAIPSEYYRVHWYSFANNPITRCPIAVSSIDTTTIKLQSGTDYYLQSIIGNYLDAKERVALAIAYRKLKEQFASEPSIKGINDNLTRDKGAITTKDLVIAMDVSQKSNWESSLIPHLNDLPFQFIGKGEQNALKIMLALDRKANDSHVILIEEPENHLSFSSMNTLLSKIRERCAGKQILIVTHSGYVLNKLGIEKVTLLHEQNTMSLKDLSSSTQDYFKKLSGYDTLRLILAKRAILVEGPSDELIVQKAYILKYGKLPIEDGVDIINVRGLSFARFLEISKLLNKSTAVVTDNDGDYQKNVIRKYSDYDGVTCIKICADSDNGAVTLEPQIAKINDLTSLNGIFGTEIATKDAMVAYMTEHKTDCALAIFETKEHINLPDYINNALQ